MKKFFRQLSFRRKLLISFVTLSCIPVLLVGIAAYHLYTNFIINMTEKSSIETIDLVCDDIDSLLNDAWTLCDMLTGDIKIQKYLRMDFDSIRDQYSNDLAGSMELASTPTARISSEYMCSARTAAATNPTTTHSNQRTRGRLPGIRPLRAAGKPPGFLPMRAASLSAVLSAITSLRWDSR